MAVRTLTEALVRHARERPRHPAVLYRAAGNGPAARLSYEELDRRARLLAGRLAGRDVAGRPVLVVLGEGPHPAVALAGCVYAGAVAVPVPPPGRSRATAGRIMSIAKDCGARLVLAGPELAAGMSRELSLAGLGAVECFAVDAAGPAGDAAPGPGPVPPDPDALALLHYNAGPSVAPRGMMFSHRALGAGLAAIGDALRSGPDARIAGVLPSGLGAALFGQLLHPLWLGATLLTGPADPAGDSARWLARAASDGATHVLAADSFCAHCLDVTAGGLPEGMDLTPVRTVMTVTEPGDPAVADGFARRFAPAGLRPGALVTGYAPTGTALLVTEEWPGDGIRLVDPDTGSGVPEGAAGEIWVRGAWMGHGYWRRPLETERVLGARTADGGRGCLRTGDRGTLRAGLVRYTGPGDDAVTAPAGVWHPQDVERELHCLQGGFGPAAVFRTEGADRERPVVVQEVHAGLRPRHELPGLAARIRDRVADEFGIEVGRVLLVRPGTVRRRVGGRVPRVALRDMLARDELRPLHVDPVPERTP